jgi:hypothetical protein
VSGRPVGPVGLNGPGWALARTNSRTVYKYIYLTELIIYNNILFIYIETTKYLCMHFIFMYAFYICLAVYLVFTYYERIKCIYIFSIYINIGPGRAKARGPPYLPIPGPLNGPCRPGPVTDRAGPCLDRTKFVPCHGPNGRPALFGHLYSQLHASMEIG